MHNPNGAPSGSSEQNNDSIFAQADEKYRAADDAIVETFKISQDTPKPMDADNLNRIDNQINQDIENDINSEKAEAGEQSREELKESGNKSNLHEKILEDWEAFKKTPLAKKAISAGIALLAVGTAVGIVIGAGGGDKGDKTPSEPAPIAYELGTEEVADDSEQEKDWIEYTGIDEYDKTVDGSYAQYGDKGMTDTEKHTDENPNVGKFSQYSVAAPNDLAREYFGAESFEDLSLEQKSLCFQMSTYKQDFSAMGVLQVIDSDYQNKDFKSATLDFRNADQEVKDQKTQELIDFFANATVGETTVGDLRNQFSNMPGAEKAVEYLDNHDGTLQEVTTDTVTKLVSSHLYALGDHTPHEQAVNTPDSCKVLEYTYSVSESEEYTVYTLERCFNMFVIHTKTDKITKTSTINVTFYGDNETIQEKDAENLKRIDNNIEEKIEENVNTDDFDPGNTEDVTKEEQPTETPSSEEYTNPENNTQPQIIERQPEVNPDTGQQEQPATPVTPTNPENNYSQDLGGANQDNANPNPVVANPGGQAQSDAGEIPINDAPSGGAELDNILADLGIGNGN